VLDFVVFKFKLPCASLPHVKSFLIIYNLLFKLKRSSSVKPETQRLVGGLVAKMGPGHADCKVEAGWLQNLSPVKLLPKRCVWLILF
jgi:hypothetical protein